MNNNSSLVAIFQSQPVRRYWDNKKEKWYFSVVDIIAVLAQNQRPRKYWDDLKRKLKLEGSEVSEKIGQLKLPAKDGKFYLTDVADVETVLRLVQSVPSPKAESFKLWLARVGYERLQETTNPELAVNRGRRNWQNLGRSQKWIEQRMLGLETRNKLTDYWSDHGIEKQIDYAKLTNTIHEEWSGLTVKGHKKLKKLTHHNLRDHMTEAELIFTALAELSSRHIAIHHQATGYQPNLKAAKKGGKISGSARKSLEKQTQKKIISPDNFLLTNKKFEQNN